MLFLNVCVFYLGDRVSFRHSTLFFPEIRFFFGGGGGGGKSQRKRGLVLYLENTDRSLTTFLREWRGRELL